jgi:hypothetical protein
MSAVCSKRTGASDISFILIYFFSLQVPHSPKRDGAGKPAVSLGTRSRLAERLHWWPVQRLPAYSSLYTSEYNSPNQFSTIAINIAKIQFRQHSMNLLLYLQVG